MGPTQNQRSALLHIIRQLIQILGLGAIVAHESQGAVIFEHIPVRFHRHHVHIAPGCAAMIAHGLVGAPWIYNALPGLLRG